MGPPLRIQATSLKDALFKSPFKYEFFQGVRLLEQILKPDSSLGDGSFSKKEAVILNSHVTLSPPPSDIQDLKILNNHQAKIKINILTLAGISGPLPAPYTELILDRLKKKDTGLQDFLDIFNHRLGAIYYRTYKTTTPAFDLVNPEETLFGKTLINLSGLHLAYKDSLEFNLRSFLKYAGLFWTTQKSVAGLENILSDVFKTPVEIFPLQDSMYDLPKDIQTTVGTFGKNNQLGFSALIGKRTSLSSSHFIIKIGPIHAEKSKIFFKHEDGYKLLNSFVESYLGVAYSFDLRVEVIPSPNKQIAQDKQFLGWNVLAGKPKNNFSFSVHLTPKQR